MSIKSDTTRYSAHVPRTFDTWSEAFAACRAADRPLRVVVVEPCDDCCRESEGNSKRQHKVYPSGWAVPLTVAADEASEVQP